MKVARGLDHIGCFFFLLLILCDCFFIFYFKIYIHESLLRTTFSLNSEDFYKPLVVSFLLRFHYFFFFLSLQELYSQLQDGSILCPNTLPSPSCPLPFPSPLIECVIQSVPERECFPAPFFIPIVWILVFCFCLIHSQVHVFIR